MFLLSAPSEIQQNIFNHMDPQDLFLMSHCSSLTKEAIKNSIVWTKSSEVIARFSGSEEAEEGGEKCVNFGVLTDEKRWNVFEMKQKTREKSRKYGESLKLNIDGLMISGDAKFRKSGKMVLFVDNFENKLNQIYSYICQLLQLTDDLFVQLDSLDEYKLFSKNSIKKSVLYNESRREIGWKNLDQFFKDHPTQHVSTIVTPRIKSCDLTENEKFTGLRNLLLIDVGYDIYRVMMNFEGEHLVMHKALPHHTSITYFVNSWMEGNHKNLKSIISYNRCGWHINIDIVLDDLKPEKWDETKRPRYFEYTSVLQKQQDFKPDVFDCQKGLDLTRKTDGAIATIKIDEGRFMFFVWP